MGKELKVFVIDDSIVFRDILVSIVESLQEVRCVGKAYSGEVALSQLRKIDVDLIIIDLFMPDMNGLDTFKAIKEQYPKLPVVMISGVVGRNDPLVIEALRLGAIEFIEKPNRKVNKTFRTELEKRLREAICKISSENYPAMPRLTQATQRHRRRITQVNLVLIASSIGGPSALQRVIPRLNKALGCPVLVVQHMPEIFTTSLAKHLEKQSQMPVFEAVSGMPIQQNQVTIAPGGHHMEMVQIGNEYKVLLNQDPPVNTCRPSIDVLFESVAKNFKGEVLVVVLTGMGKDGTAGVQAIRKALPMYCIVQSPDTCIVDGMPKSVIQAELADKILPIDAIAEAINLLVLRNRETSKETKSSFLITKANERE